MSSQTSRGALIGCGFVSRFHLEGWRRVPGASIVAVCDLDAERAKAATALAPEAEVYEDAELMLDRVRPDFVEICTRPDSHRPLVEAAAARGAHVLCQKPTAPSRDDLLAMISACESARVRLMIHENWRFRPWYRVMRDRIREGVVGKPLQIRVSHRDTRALRPDGFKDQPYFSTMPNLILYEMGPHLVDVARFLMGEAVSVSATVRRLGDGHVGDDFASVGLEFESGAIGRLEMSWCSPPELARPEWALNQTVVEGTEGALSVREDGSLLRVGLDGSREVLAVPLPPDDLVYVDGYAATQRHFVAALRDGTAIETDGADNLATMDVVWGGYRSARERTVVKLGSGE